MATTSVRNNGGTMVSPLLQSKRLFTCNPISSLALPRIPLQRPALTLARRRNNVGRPISKKNKSHSKADIGKDNDLDEDAFEALFKQLEEDLKKDEESLGDGEDDISEEDLAMLERELEEALADDEDLSELLSLMAGNSNGFGIDSDEQKEEIIDHVEVEDEEKEDDGIEEKDEDDDDDDDDSEEPIKLKGWQLRRVAKALKVGRRKTSIKNLAAELCLDRAVVLELLRNPSPDVLMMSTALPDNDRLEREPEAEEGTVIMMESETTPTLTPIPLVSPSSSKPEIPIHALQSSWSAQKRIKKAHVNTLESVYRCTKRPTNAMISSVVQVTNIPRKRVVKWFEDRRSADGVPEQRRPYQPPISSLSPVLANK